VSGTPSPQSGLRRILGVGFGLAVIIGSTLGIGILRTPGLVASQIASPPGILTVWIVGGLYTLLGAVCLTELGAMLPEAGGYYVYARRAFGDTVGFAVGWTDWLTYCAVCGYVSIAIGEFAGVLAPSLASAVKPIAIAALLMLVALQWIGVRAGSRFQEITTAVKFAAFLVLVVLCFAFSGRADVAAAADISLPTATLAGVVIALQSVMITFGGWQSALYFTEEDRDPDRNLPRSMIGGVALVLGIYVLVNLALLSVLPVPALARSTLPAADAAQAIIGGRGREVITLLSLVSLPPLLNAILMIGTRILFAMGRDRLVWLRTAAVNAGGTPGIAMLVTTAVAVVLIATGTFQRLVAMASFFLAANYAVSCLALIVLRRREPDRVRPFLAWGYPWSAGIVLLGAAAFMIGVLTGDTANGVAAIVLLAAGLVGRALVARRAGGVQATAIVIAALAVGGLAAEAFQGGRFRGAPISLDVPPNPRYDGRFAFVRLKYETAPGGYWYRGLPSWAHGYPTSEVNLMRIMNEITSLDAHVEDTAVLTLDDPELFKYPVAYFIEAGWWTLTDTEAAALRTYLQKGGFVILDDFKIAGTFGFGGGGWERFEENMKRVMPEARFVEMDTSHPIFHTFFEIETLDHFPQAYNSGPAIFRGLYEDNDPHKRLQMIINYNTDISQFWEWSGRGLRPIDQTNEAYKLGVNYLVYGITH
jgi:APA family basic amino acid/polyamine antiporter